MAFFNSTMLEKTPDGEYLDKEVNNEQVKAYSARLFEETFGETGGKNDKALPDEAVNYIGKDRVLAEQKIDLIANRFCWAVIEVLNGENDQKQKARARLEEAIKLMVSASENRKKAWRIFPGSGNISGKNKEESLIV